MAQAYIAGDRLGLDVVGRLSMFVDVQTLLFDAARYAQAVNLIQSLEDDESHGSGPDTDDYGSKQLCSEEAGTCSIEEPFGSGEETSEDGSCESANSVYRAGTYGVVNLQYLVDEIYGENHQDTADTTDDGRTQG